MASHVKGQALIYPAYLPDVHTRKGCFPYCKIGKYQFVCFLVLDIERKYLFGNGQKRNDGFHISFLPFDADFRRAVSIIDDMLRFEPLHVHTSQTSEGTEKEELSCSLELSVNDRCLQYPLQFLRSEITPCVVWKFCFVVCKRIDADILLLLTDADEFPQENDRYQNGGKREVAL